MSDTLDEIKSNLPVETTTAYAGVMAIANQDGVAGNISIMTVVFVVLMVFTVILTLIRTKSPTLIALAASGFVIWVANIDITRFSNIIADIYVRYFLEPDGDPSEFTDGLSLILPCVAILYSVLITIVSAARARAVRGVANG